MRPYPHRMSRRMFVAGLASTSVLAAAPALARAGKVLRDVKYGPALRQALDIYLPANPPTNMRGAPVMVMVHGGGWVIGDKSNKGVWREKVAHWGAQGYIFVSVNYRMLPVADPLEQARDVARAIAWVQENAARHGGDATRMVVMGHSAGGHLVSLLAADPTLAAEHGARPWRGTISLDTAAFDVVDIMTNRHARLYDRAFGDDPALWHATSATARLKPHPRPFLLVCSTQRARSCARNEAFAQALTAKGGTSTLLPLDLAHNQINTELGRPGAYTRAVDGFLAGIMT